MLDLAGDENWCNDFNTEDSTFMASFSYLMSSRLGDEMDVVDAPCLSEARMTLDAVALKDLLSKKLVVNVPPLTMRRNKVP